MVAALEQDLDPALVQHLLDLLADPLVAQDVALGVARPPVEGAEAAVGDADVGVVDVALDDVGDDPLGVERHPPLVGQGAQDVRVALLEQERALGVREPLAAGGFLIGGHKVGDGHSEALHYHALRVLRSRQSVQESHAHRHPRHRPFPGKLLPRR